MRRQFDIVLALAGFCAGFLLLYPLTIWSLASAGLPTDTAFRSGRWFAWLEQTVPVMAWPVNIIALLMFVVGVHFWFTPRMIRSAHAMTADPSGAAGLRILRLIGAPLAGFVLAGFVTLPWLYVLPALTFTGVIVVLAGLDFFLARSPRWRTIREGIGGSSKGMLALVGPLLFADALIVVITMSFTELLLPILVVALSIMAFFVVDSVLQRSRIWAVARHMISESIRTKAAWICGGLIIGYLVLAPFFWAQGDGVTLKSRIQTYLSHSLGWTGLVLSVMTILLACGALVQEIREKQIFMVATKPIPRWQIVAGKWLGIGVLNLVVLVLAYGVLLGFVWYLKNQPEQIAGDKDRVQAEVMTIHHLFPIDQPDWNARAAARIRELREQARWEDLDKQEVETRRQQIIREMKLRWRTLEPREIKRYQFTGLDERFVDRGSGQHLLVRIKPESSAGVDDVYFQADFMAGDPSEPDTLVAGSLPNFVVGRYHQFGIPARSVNSKGKLYIEFANASFRNTIVFEGDDGLQLLHPIGTFHWNLFRAMIIVWARLAFLSAVGLLMSSFVSFPVACLAAFEILAVASAAGWLLDAVDWSSSGPAGDDSLWIFGPILRPMALGFVQLVPDFSRFNAIENVVSGHLVPMHWVLMSLATLVFLQGLILLIVGAVVFTRRELAQVVV